MLMHHHVQLAHHTRNQATVSTSYQQPGYILCNTRVGQATSKTGPQHVVGRAGCQQKLGVVCLPLAHSMHLTIQFKSCLSLSPKGMGMVAMVVRRLLLPTVSQQGTTKRRLPASAAVLASHTVVRVCKHMLGQQQQIPRQEFFGPSKQRTQLDS